MDRIADQMTGGSDDDLYWWCIKDRTVEQGPVCPGQDRLGPYATALEASRAVEHAQARTDDWDKADEEWDSDVEPGATSLLDPK